MALTHFLMTPLKSTTMSSPPTHLQQSVPRTISSLKKPQPAAYSALTQVKHLQLARILLETFRLDMGQNLLLPFNILLATLFHQCRRSLLLLQGTGGRRNIHLMKKAHQTWSVLSLWTGEPGFAAGRNAQRNSRFVLGNATQINI